MNLFGIYLSRRTLFLVLADVCLILGSIFGSYELRFLHDASAPAIDLIRYWKGAIGVAVLLHLIGFYVFELYDLQVDFRRGSAIVRCLVAVAATCILAAAASFMLPHWHFGRGVFGLHAIFLALAVVGFRYAFTAFVRRYAPAEKAILVTGTSPVGPLVADLLENPARWFDLVGTLTSGLEPISYDAPALSSLGTLDDGPAALRAQDVRHMFLGGIDHLPDETVGKLLAFKTSGIEVHELSRVYRGLQRRVPVDHVDGMWFILGPGFAGENHPFVSNTLRIADVIGAVLTMTLSAPLWILAAIGIRLTMPGPVFFTQERVGHLEKPYVLYKFRSMRLDAERDGPQWAVEGDPRVTAFGRFLRRTRIDELPQLWNVLRGDMSLVGPRPERRHFVDLLKARIPHYGLRFMVKPGVTGWAQVNRPISATEEDAKVKLSYELYYIQERSLVLYTIVLMKTVPTVIFKPGT